MVACHVQQLRAFQPPTTMSEKTGQHTVVLELVNTSARVCLLRGYPAVVLRSGSRVLPFPISHAGDQMVTDQPPVTVSLRPRAGAWVMLNKYRCDLGDRAAVTSIEIAGLRVPLVRGVLGWCGRGDPGSTVAVSPYEPTFAATVRLPTCDATELSARAGFKGAAAGQFIQTITLTNRDSVCELRGWPGVHGVATRRVVQGGAPRFVTLRAGGAASFDLFGEDYDHRRQRTCPLRRSIAVVLRGALTVRLKLPHCGAWYVSPFVAGRSDRVAWTRVVGH